MSKRILLILVLVFLTACATTKKEDKVVITGKFSWTEWEQKAMWEHYTADDYNPGQFMVEQIKEIAKSPDIKYLLFAGSWCGDSKTEVPKIYKLFELSEIPFTKIEMFGVDRSKREPTGTAENYQIEKVPTLIILKGGTETGRIVEFPQTSWEEDIFKILIK